ncbi:MULTISPECIES: MurR/RpiR family transcriptional regulator [unclassified Pseudoclavibacter]|uniref:MurR/RpiR family transcriptional regulator n=1 Tax=unclassified Pseudoclavibacter TaxID=2615177 RepID=UPI001BA61B48|nr:MurR/RpiR family transcriptional regulator [Pseudoclavibacter sp. Marseille-Q4354]MBS3178862.1 MurR/RpiR family transcriptional regulator [Pseudoclavibacter sp. Marseille-Q4354]
MSGLPTPSGLPPESGREDASVRGGSVARPELSVLARVRAASAALGPSERKVAQMVLTRPDEVVEWSTAELADAAGTSTATVIRACQSLGFRGFQHLRLDLARSASLAPREQAQSVEASTFDDAIDAVRLAQDSVDPERIAAAVAALRGARRIVLVGSGFSGPPLQDFAMRLSTLGHSVEAPVDALAQQFAVRSLSSGDACLTLSYSGANVQSLRAAEAARAQGAAVVLITSYARSPLGRVADIVVTTGPAGTAHDIDPFLARLGHTVVLHTLHSTLGQVLGDDAAVGMRHVVADALSED